MCCSIKLKIQHFLFFRRKKVSEHLPVIKCDQKQTTGLFSLLMLPTSDTFLAAHLLADLITPATKGNDKLCHPCCRQE